jgi:hypothetical protein
MAQKKGLFLRPSNTQAAGRHCPNLIRNLRYWNRSVTVFLNGFCNGRLQIALRAGGTSGRGRNGKDLRRPSKPLRGWGPEGVIY